MISQCVRNINQYEIEKRGKMLNFHRVSEAIMYLTVCFNNKLWCPFLRPPHGFPIVFVVYP